LRELFKFGRLHAIDLAIVATAGIGCVVASEVVKRILGFGKEMKT